VILYEYPLNERIRTLLRLEDLFERLDVFSARASALDHHVVLLTLFDILEVTARADLKSDLLQELERQRQTLLGFRSSPNVSIEALERILTQIDRAWNDLNNAAGKTGQHLRDNEWLMSIRSRATIAGGATEFDLPSYHAWQHRPEADRAQDITAWITPFRPLRDSLTIVLKLLRESGQSTAQTALNGGFQQPLGGKVFQMVQVRIPETSRAIPEISANKYLLWIRFTAQDGDLRPRAFDGNVDFSLTLCNL
jgi:cell division protein ZapD